MNRFGIDSIQKQFLCCTPLHSFKWPDQLSNTVNETLQKQIIAMTVNCNVVLKYPIKQSYKKAFLKMFINKLEENGQEIEDDVYQTYCDAIACTEKSVSMHYRHYIDCTKNIISLKESTNIISEGTTGLCSWKAAFSLSDWCVYNKQRIFNKNILEIGSGVGLAGLTIVTNCEPRAYYFSDCHPMVLNTLEENVRLNLLEKNQLLWKEIHSENRSWYTKKEEQTRVTVMHFNWDDIGSLDLKSMEIDLVIAADILYDNRTFESLASCLKTFLSSTVEYVILAATIRNETTVSEFLSKLDKNDLAFKEETAPSSQIFIHSEDTPVRILKIFSK